jgi:hypothetical protein
MHKEIMDGRSLITIHGKIEYEDLFGVSHWVTFCQETGGRWGCGQVVPTSAPLTVTPILTDEIGVNEPEAGVHQPVNRQRSESRASNMAVQYLIDGEAMPRFSLSPGEDANVVQRGRYAIKGHPRGPEFPHAGDDDLFALRRTIGLTAFTVARPSFHSLACTTKFEYDVCLFALCDGTLKLPEHHSVRIILQQIGASASTT